MLRAFDVTKDMETVDDSTPHMRDNLGKDLIIHSIKYGKGEHSEWMMATVSESDKGPKGSMFLSGQNVLRRLHAIEDADGFPCVAKFVRTKKGFDIE